MQCRQRDIKKGSRECFRVPLRLSVARALPLTTTKNSENLQRPGWWAEGAVVRRLSSRISQKFTMLRLDNMLLMSRPRLLKVSATAIHLRQCMGPGDSSSRRLVCLGITQRSSYPSNRKWQVTSQAMGLAIPREQLIRRQLRAQLPVFTVLPVHRYQDTRAYPAHIPYTRQSISMGWRSTASLLQQQPSQTISSNSRSTMGPVREIRGCLAASIHTHSTTKAKARAKECRHHCRCRHHQISCTEARASEDMAIPRTINRNIAMSTGRM